MLSLSHNIVLGRPTDNAFYCLLHASLTTGTADGIVCVDYIIGFLLWLIEPA